MNRRKFLSITFLLFLFVAVTDPSAFAERTCTHQIEDSGGTKTIITDCTSSHNQTSEITRNWHYISFLVSNFMDRVNQGIQNMQSQFSTMITGQDPKQLAADTRQKEQDARDMQRQIHEGQDIQAEALKDRLEMQKLKQQDSRRALNERH
ncbi:MAG: hypothetical protein HQL14_03550 [Candidatus Omnitrophica bacterium]|nr:hypothetical protein [Candidatus Omnitrophota bacterium]